MNPIVILFLILSVFSAGSATIARYEMKRADVLQVSLNQANKTIDAANQYRETTEKASHENQNRISDLNRKLSSVRMRDPVCVVLSGVSPGRRDGSGEPAKLVGSLGVNSAWADELIAEGDRYQSQVIELQQIVKSQQACNAK